MKVQNWILGGGGHAKVVIATIDSVGGSVSGVFDDDQQKVGNHLLNVEIVGPMPDEKWWLDEPRNAIIAIGDNGLREKLSSIGAAWMIAQHAGAIVHPSVTIGEGSLICAGVVVQPDTKIGRHVIANTSCSIDHDCRIGNFSHVGPGACLAGGVSLGVRSFVGAGATIIPGVNIGDDVTIGAGAVVIDDVASGKTVVGVPAREVDHE